MHSNYSYHPLSLISHLPLPKALCLFPTSSPLAFVSFCCVLMWPTAFNHGLLCDHRFGTIHWRLVDSPVVHNWRQWLALTQNPSVANSTVWSRENLFLSLIDCWQDHSYVGSGQAHSSDVRTWLHLLCHAQRTAFSVFLPIFWLFTLPPTPPISA